MTVNYDSKQRTFIPTCLLGFKLNQKTYSNCISKTCADMTLWRRIGKRTLSIGGNVNVLIKLCKWERESLHLAKINWNFHTSSFM